MKPGDTLLYRNMDREGILGLVTTEPAWDEYLQAPAVKVFWMDDCTATNESVATIESDEEEYNYMRIL